jgi:hypothetical protein
VAATGLLTATGGAVAGTALPSLTVNGTQGIASPHGGALTFRAALSAASASAVTVHFATEDGTAVAGADYTAASGTLTIPAGSTSGSVKVTLLAQPLGAAGSDKAFTLALSHPAGATLATKSATGTVHPGVYLAASAKTFADAVVNPASATAYLTVPALNKVAVLNLKTGRYGRAIRVGSAPLGLDITPDGKTLYVCDSGGQTISRVDLATREVTTITTPPGDLNETPLTIAVMNNGNAIYTTTFAGSGFGGHAYDLNLSTGVSTLVTGLGSPGGQVTEASPVSRSRDYSTVGLVIGDDSRGAFDVYTAATGKVVSGSLNDEIASSSVNGDGSTMLVSGNGATYVIDAATGSLLGSIGCARGLSVLNASGSTGYCVVGQSVVTLNVKRFLTGQVINLPQQATSGALPALSPNGRVLVVPSNGGATIVEV